jgi:hypothetical protein
MVQLNPAPHAGVRGGMRPYPLLLLCASLPVLPPLPALAQEARRALTEPKDARTAVQKVKPDLLKADPALAACLPARHLSTASADWACKVGALRAAAAQEKVDPDKPLPQNPGLKNRAQLVNHALETADALGWFKPASDPPKDLANHQVAAQAEACRAAQELYLALADVPEQKPIAPLLLEGFAASDAARLSGRPLKAVACGCHERTLALGRAGFLSDRDPAMAAAQRNFLGLACNLKTTGRESSLVAAQRGSTEVDLSGVGGSARGADVDKDEAQRVADRRKTELKMCVDEKDRGAQAAEKAARCACPLAQRWRFPKRDGEAVLQVKVQITEKLPTMTLDINPRGIVDKCVM